MLDLFVAYLDGRVAPGVDREHFLVDEPVEGVGPERIRVRKVFLLLEQAQHQPIDIGPQHDLIGHDRDDLIDDGFLLGLRRLHDEPDHQHTQEQR